MGSVKVMEKPELWRRGVWFSRRAFRLKEAEVLESLGGGESLVMVGSGERSR